MRGFRFKRLLVVGTEEEIRAGCYPSAIKPLSVLATIWAFEARYDLPTIFQPTLKSRGDSDRALGLLVYPRSGPDCRPPRESIEGF